MLKIAIITSLVLMIASFAQAQDQPPDDDEASAHTEAISDAVDAAEHWLAIVDSAGWPASYTEAAQFFKSAVAPDVWIRQIKTARTPLGRLISRELTGSQYATTLPGAPDGEYVVLRFSSKFENKTEAVETVTPMKDPDGTWRVAGYFIK